MAHDHDHDTHADANAPSDQPQVAALGDLGDYEVSEGYPDPRGWDVTAANGDRIGKVHELIVDTGTMRTRYLDVRLDRSVAGASGDRDVLVPVGSARLDDRDDRVLVDGLSPEQVAALPAYEHGSLTRDHERSIRQHFGGGAAAAGMAAGAGAAGTAGSRDFYDHEQFDDNRLFAGRRDRTADRRGNVDDVANTGADRLTLAEEQLQVGKQQVQAGEATVRKTVETERVSQQVPLTHDEVTVERHALSGDAPANAQIGEDELRMTLMREEAVVRKRMVPTEELVIRKRMVQTTQTVEADLRREVLDESGLRTTGTTGTTGSAGAARGSVGSDSEVGLSGAADRATNSGPLDRLADKADDLKDRVDGNPNSRPGPDATDRRI